MTLLHNQFNDIIATIDVGISKWKKELQEK